MLNFHIEIDGLLAEMQGEIEHSKQLIHAAVGGLAAATNKFIVDEASKKLHSRYEAYKKALKFSQVEDNLWVIELDASALWIEEGKAAGSALDDLLKSPKAKTNKKGEKYIVVPFKHDKGPSQQTNQARSITDILKNELKKEGVGWKKLDRHPDGSVKEGLVHSGNHGGPKKEHWSHHALSGVRIYQTALKNPDGSVKTDKKGAPQGRRDVLTFRIASESQRGKKWNMPELAGVKLFEAGEAFAAQMWNQEILPELLRSK